MLNSQSTQSDNGCFLGTFIMRVKIAQAGEGGGVHARGLQFYTFLKFQKESKGEW